MKAQERFQHSAVTHPVQNRLREILGGSLCMLALASCVSPEIPRPLVPSAEYSRYVQAQMANANPAPASGADASVRTVADTSFRSATPGGSRAQLRLVDGDYREPAFRAPAAQPPAPEFEESPRSAVSGRGYTGPLAYGDPGVSSSLWRESRSENDLFRDHRAIQPMDLITIVVSEKSEGKGDATTETTIESELSASAENLLGLEKYLTRANRNIDLASLLKASTTNDFTGEGATNRKGSLTATISAMVVEVLPSGILRVEGEKIIAVNNEEQTMVISGLVRPRDVSSENSVDSAKIANLRIDYYGKGVVGESQYGGWLGRMLRVLWPF